MDPRRCVILVPFATSITPPCERALEELERRGYPVRRVGGYAAIDQGRNQMATDALLDGFEETMWIDADVDFHPNAIDRLRSHRLPIVCGIYPQKGKRALASHVMPGAPKMVFGKDGGLVEILYAGAGFLLVRREAYMAIQQRLPMCNERFKVPLIPVFPPDASPVRKMGIGTWPKTMPSANAPGRLALRSWPTQRFASGTSAITPMVGKTPGWIGSDSIRLCSTLARSLRQSRLPWKSHQDIFGLLRTIVMRNCDAWVRRIVTDR